MLRCCNCETEFESEDSLTDIIEESTLINGDWVITDTFIMNPRTIIPEEDDFHRYERIKGCPYCLTDGFLIDLQTKELR